MTRACPCGNPARPRGLGHRRGYASRPNPNLRGDSPYLCLGCQQESLRRTWRDSKRRRAAAKPKATKGRGAYLGYIAVKRTKKSEAA